MDFSSLAASKMLHFFEEISKIPRPSGHEEKIADYIESFLKDRKIEYIRDAKNNVFASLPATEGREDEDALMLIEKHMSKVSGFYKVSTDDAVIKEYENRIACILQERVGGNGIVTVELIDSVLNEVAAESGLAQEIFEEPKQLEEVGLTYNDLVSANSVEALLQKYETVTIESDRDEVQLFTYKSRPAFLNHVIYNDDEEYLGGWIDGIGFEINGEEATIHQANEYVTFDKKSYCCWW